VREVSPYLKEVKVKAGNTEVDLGLLDEIEQENLKEHLRDVCEDLGYED